MVQKGERDSALFGASKKTPKNADTEVFTHDIPSPEDRIWAALAYVGLPFGMLPPLFIALLKREDSAYTGFHAIQSLLFGLFVISLIFLDSMTLPVLALYTSISSVGMILFQLTVLLATFGLWVTLVIQTFRGQKAKLPLFGKLAEACLKKTSSTH